MGKHPRRNHLCGRDYKPKQYTGQTDVFEI